MDRTRGSRSACAAPRRPECPWSLASLTPFGDCDGCVRPTISGGWRISTRPSRRCGQGTRLTLWVSSPPPGRIRRVKQPPSLAPFSTRGRPCPIAPGGGEPRRNEPDEHFATSFGIGAHASLGKDRAPRSTTTALLDATDARHRRASDTARSFEPSFSCSPSCANPGNRRRCRRGPGSRWSLGRTLSRESLVRTAGGPCTPRGRRVLDAW